MNYPGFLCGEGRYEVTLFSVALYEQMILFGQRNCSLKLADVSTRCSIHPQGKSEARCEKGGALIGVATALARRVQRVERRRD